MTRVLLAMGLALAVAAGVQTYRLQALKADVAQEHAALAQAKADAESRAREAEQRMADSARKAADVYSQHVARIRADADGARSALAGLLDAAGSTGDAAQDSAAAAGADDAARARFVAGQCAASLRQVAEAADSAEGRLAALQNYVNAVLLQGQAK